MHLTSALPTALTLISNLHLAREQKAAFVSCQATFFCVAASVKLRWIGAAIGPTGKIVFPTIGQVKADSPRGFANTVPSGWWDERFDEVQTRR